MKEECLRSLYQPVLLLYELQDTTTPRTSHSHLDIRTQGDEIAGQNCESATPSVLRQMFAQVDLATALSLSASAPSPQRPDDKAAASSASHRSNRDLTARACSRSRSASFTDSHCHIPPIMPIKIFEVRFTVTYVTLTYDTSSSRRLLGFEHNLDENGRVVITDFLRHPETGSINAASCDCRAL